MNRNRMVGSLMACLVMVMLIGADAPPSSPLEKAYASLVHWKGLHHARYKELRAMIERASEQSLPVRSVLFGIDGELVYVAHIGWSVAICHVTEDLAIQAGGPPEKNE